MQVDNSCLNKSLLPLREVKKEQAKRICDKSGGSGFFFFFLLVVLNSHWKQMNTFVTPVARQPNSVRSTNPTTFLHSISENTDVTCIYLWYNPPFSETETSLMNSVLELFC